MVLVVKVISYLQFLTLRYICERIEKVPFNTMYKVSLRAKTCKLCKYTLRASISLQRKQLEKQNKVQQRAHHLCFYIVPSQVCTMYEVSPQA